MPQKCLHLLYMNAVHQQMNRKAVTEGVRRHRIYRKADTLCAGARQGSADPVSRRFLAGHVPDGGRPARHHAEGGKQLAHAGNVGRIRQRDRPEGRYRLCFTGRAAPTARRALLQGAQPQKGHLGVEKKVARAERQRLVQPRARVPQRVDKRPLLQIGQEAEQLADFGRQQVAGHVKAGSHGHFAQPYCAGPAARQHQGRMPSVSVGFGYQIH